MTAWLLSRYLFTTTPEASVGSEIWHRGAAVIRRQAHPLEPWDLLDADQIGARQISFGTSGMKRNCVRAGANSAHEQSPLHHRLPAPTPRSEDTCAPRNPFTAPVTEHPSRRLSTRYPAARNPHEDTPNRTRRPTVTGTAGRTAPPWPRDWA